MSNSKISEEDFSFYDLFVPLTNRKVIAFLFVIGFFVFFNALFGAFVWDDLSYIQFNPDVHTFNLIHLFKENSFNQSSGQYRALTAVYFAFIYSLFKDNTFFYHLIQITLHIGNAVLLYYIFKKFFSIAVSFVLALIFLVHPIQVESVSFIGASGNVLMFLFGIIAVLLLQKDTVRQTVVKIASTYILFLFSLLFKETGVVFLFLSVAMSYLFNWGKKFIYILFTFFILGLYLFFRTIIGGVSVKSDTLQSILPITTLTFYERLLNVPALFFYYLKTFLFPAQLAIDQLWVITSIDFYHFYLPLIVDATFLISCIWYGMYLYKNHRRLLAGYIFFFLWFLAGMFIHMQIVRLDMTVADRWFYVPFAGLLGIIGTVLHTAPFKKYLKVIMTLSAIIVIALSVRTVVRNSNWSDNITLLLHDTKEIPNYENENNLATFYSLQRQPKQALVHAKKSVELYPYETNINNLAFIYENLMQYNQAEKYFQAAINSKRKSQLYPEKRDFAYLHWGGINLTKGRPDVAVHIFKEGVKANPTNGVLWSFLAYGQYKLHQHQDALYSAEKAKKYFPNISTEKLYNLILNKQEFDIHKL